MAAWRPTVVEGGLGGSACPRCGRPYRRRRRPWRERVLDGLEEAAVTVCLLWLAGIAAAGVAVLSGPRLGAGSLLELAVAVTLAGIGLLGLIVRVRRMVAARATRRREVA
jgi:hypothetical protein